MTSQLLSLFLFITSAQLPSNLGEIEITIKNIKSQKGVLIVALFENEDSFLKKSFQVKTIAPSEAGKPIVFAEIPEGKYAVSVIHDENENGELDTNWAGIPKEPFGFSRKSMGNFGPPSFEDTYIQVKEGTTKATVKMKVIL
ncbi:MAG: DUF2141 domain-containing protein [Bacteroidota bacterium]